MASARRTARCSPRSGHVAPAGDLLKRDFTAKRSNHRWVADITEFRCRDGKLYLAGIKGLHDQELQGWSMGEHQVTDLVVNALVMALGRRMPDGDLIHHADHGSQYTSLEFTNRLTDWDLSASYGSVGDCFDNAAMESTWGTIKKEIVHICGPWEEMTRSQLRTVLFEYIERSTTGNDTKPASDTFSSFGYSSLSRSSSSLSGSGSSGLSPSGSVLLRGS